MNTNKIIAMKECANGNSDAGTSWIETAIFSEEAELYCVLAWADKVGGNGRLMISRDSKK